MGSVLTEVQSTNLSLGGESNGDRWKAVIFNNETNSVEEVVYALILATKCEVEEAYVETWEAETYGKAPVHFASYEECAKVCRSLSTIGLKTELAKEWDC
jgi:ATP-dependent Clp protease adaptor protein ClpS